jgi:hypothetical protein
MSWATWAELHIGKSERFEIATISERACEYLHSNINGHKKVHLRFKLLRHVSPSSIMTPVTHGVPVVVLSVAIWTLKASRGWQLLGLTSHTRLDSTVAPRLMHRQTCAIQNTPRTWVNASGSGRLNPHDIWSTEYVYLGT